MSGRRRWSRWRPLADGGNGESLTGHTVWAVSRWVGIPYCRCASLESAAEDVHMERPSKSHSFPKTVRHPGQSLGNLHPAFALAYDTRVIAQSGIGLLKSLGANMKALRRMGGDNAKWGDWAIAFDRLTDPKIVSLDTLIFCTNA